MRKPTMALEQETQERNDKAVTTNESEVHYTGTKSMPFIIGERLRNYMYIYIYIYVCMYVISSKTTYWVLFCNIKCYYI